MPSTATSILRDLRSALMQSGLFADVTVGSPSSSADVPRACLVAGDGEELPADHSSAARWQRLCVRLLIHAREDDAAEAVGRIADLASQAAAAMLLDPTRRGLCQDLPAGKATEVGRTIIDRTVKRPDIEAEMVVRCHYSIAPAAAPSAAIDGRSVFSSGPHTVQGRTGSERRCEGASPESTAKWSWTWAGAGGESSRPAGSRPPLPPS